MDFDAKQFPEDFLQRCSEETLCSYSSYGYVSRVFPLHQVICQIYLIRQNRELLYFKHQNWTTKKIKFR